MKIQKAEEIRQLSAEALGERLTEAKDAFFQKKLQHSLGKLEDSASLRESRREIARLNTVITEKVKGNR
ncbi:MAG: 50S ribosomal protein L29 [Fibrobacteres bacterium]|jgi:large subunit ribosomal protein L29|nr:50S ribosomal protein L29 [Fibrobacterota bacterium]